LLGVTDQLSMLSSESLFWILLGLLLPSFFILRFFLLVFGLLRQFSLHSSPTLLMLRTDEITVMKRREPKLRTDSQPLPPVEWTLGRLWGGG
jgi:hypothetical protein